MRVVDGHFKTLHAGPQIKRTAHTRVAVARPAKFTLCYDIGSSQAAACPACRPIGRVASLDWASFLFVSQFTSLFFLLLCSRCPPLTPPPFPGRQRTCTWRGFRV